MRKIGLLSIIISALIILAIFTPATFAQTLNYGYAMFRDGDGDVFQSDEEGQYTDCHIGGEDRVRIYTNTDGSFNRLEFYPAKMYQDKQYPPSTRGVKFLFNVSGINTLSGYAVRDILRWYKDGSSYIERCTNGYLDNFSLHAPVVANEPVFSTDRIQFAVEPNTKRPGRDIKSITLGNVWNYNKKDKNEGYWYTTDEPAKYIIYTIDYGTRFEVNAIGWYDNERPKTWRVSIPSGTSPRLYVNLGSYNGEIKELATYPSVQFELVVSLESIASYPSGTVNSAPKKITSVSTVWGDIKSR